jgi:gliding motility-associated-like protein
MLMLLTAALLGKKPGDLKEMLIKYKYFFSRLSFMSVFLFLFVKDSHSQGYNTTNWRFSNPKQFGFTVYDVDFFDNNNVIAVGTDGGIAKSTDGGANWTYGVYTFINANGLLFKPVQFSDVHYITANIAYAVGQGITGNAASPFIGGVMIKTTDGGTSWNIVNNPLNANRKNINTCWFINKDTGYVAGQWNTLDSIPKLYLTRNGGATWDSLDAPVGGKTKVGYVNNPNLAPLTWDITAKGKEIQRIEFINDSTGYIVGSAQVHFPVIPAANATTCLPSGATITSSNNAGLVWKFSKGTLTDYSVSKERLGFNGIFNAAPNCSYRYVQITPQSQGYKAMNVYNDSTLVIISSNNNIVIRIKTGKNDSTANINVPGYYEKGKYEILNSSNPMPINNSSASGSPIPAVNAIFAFSQPLHIRKATNGKLFVPVTSNFFGGAINRMFTSVDTGRNWIEERNLPTGKTYSQWGPQAIDIAPNGKFLVSGINGLVADSTPGGRWNSTYISVPASASHDKIEFADCNNGIATGGGSITLTTDGGNTWIDKARLDFAASNYTIGGVAYPNVSTLYFAVSNGIIYKSGDQGTTLDPYYTNFNFRMNDIAAIGNDSVWAVGTGAFTVAAALRKPGIFRSFDGGLTWTEYSNFTAGTLAQSFTDVEFPSRNVGYASGTRDTVWKTTDGGITWNKLPLPTPGVTPQITYNDMFALNDNTVFLVGIGFGATTRKVVFRTTDGGNTWTDISGNIDVLMGSPIGGSSNNTSVVFHDANNGYVTSGGGSLLKTINGGVSWALDYAPAGGFAAIAFSPKKVPPAISFPNRKLFLVTLGAGFNPLAQIMEYGSPANVNVNSSETIVNANCTNLSAGSITLNASGGLAPYTYSINGGAFQASNVFSGLTQGAKTISIKDAFCGTLTKIITVGFNDNLTLATNNDTLVCAGAPVQMQATTNGAGSAFSWSPAAGLTNANISNPVATVTANRGYTVTASLNGCVRTKTVTISTKPNPVISAGPDKTILDGDIAGLQGSGSNSTQSIVWTPAASIVSGTGTYSIIVKPATTTTYTLTVKDVNNCTSTDDAVVTVILNCAKINNAFTPNGDGVNERWIVSTGTSCYTQVVAAVYNRYGGLVYKNDNYQNNWDGTYSGKPVADGTYYYTVTFKLINGRSATLTGDVTILR